MSNMNHNEMYVTYFPQFCQRIYKGKKKCDQLHHDQPRFYFIYFLSSYQLTVMTPSGLLSRSQRSRESCKANAKDVNAIQIQSAHN